MAGKKAMFALPEIRCQCGKLKGDCCGSPNRPMGTMDLKDILEQSNFSSAPRIKAQSHMTTYEPLKKNYVFVLTLLT